MKNQLRLLGVMIVMVSIISCEKNENMEIREVSADSKNEVIEQLLQNGWDIDQIQILENGNLIVGGDVEISSDINDYKSNEIVSKQLTTRWLVDTERSKHITVYIDNSLRKPGPDNWEGSIVNAMRVWSTVWGSDLKFVRTFDSWDADIVVRSDDRINNNTIALANFPKYGRAGKTIRVNLTYDNNRWVTNSQKLHNMAHEFGHAIGFRHANGLDRGEGSFVNGEGDVGIVPVLGTPRVDPNSVMNGGTADNGFRGLSF